MSRHFAVLIALVVLVAVVIHMRLGSQVGFVIAGIVIAGHLALGVVARWLLRRKAGRVDA